MELKKYVKFCKTCKIESEHFIAQERKLRGVKLRCGNCQKFQNRWLNFKTLKEYEEPELKNKIKKKGGKK